MKQESHNNYESLNPDSHAAGKSKKRFFTKRKIILLSILLVIVGLCVWDIADPPLWWQSNRQKDKRAILEYAKVQYNGEAKVVSSSFPIINPGLVGPPEDSVMRFKYNDTIFPISAKNGKVINDGYHRARAEDGIEEIMDVGFFQQRNIKATPHNYRTSCFVGVCLQIFRHLAQNLLERRQPYCVDFVQSAEKFADTTARQ